MTKQFKLLFAFVFGDFFPPFLFQVTHFNTSFIDFLPNSITLMYHLFAKKQITYAKKAGFFYFFSSLLHAVKQSAWLATLDKHRWT